MKIEDRTLTFGDLSPGDTFRQLSPTVDNPEHVRLKFHGVRHNYINLHTNHTYLGDNDMKVSRVTCKVVSE